MTHPYDDSLSLAQVYIVAPPVDLPNFRLTINTFTMKVLMYTGNSCPLCKDLLELVEKLMGRMLMNKRCAFIPTH